MNITLKQIKIRDLIEGFKNSDEDGVTGYNGMLNIRPPYQREFVYKPAQQEAVIHSVMNGHPLNVMYWVVNGENEYEVLDGQQRTMSICNYVTGGFSVDYRGFVNLDQEEKDALLDYELLIYLCSEGTNREKMQWFETINISGEKLTNQELLNAAYQGSFITDAKRRFSKTSCPAYHLGSKYLKGSPIRQDYLATVLSWVSNKNVEGFLAKEQHSLDASVLWDYYVSVISWVKDVFPITRKEMLGVQWGLLYNDYNSDLFNQEVFEQRLQVLLQDDDVTKKQGIYSYLLSGNEKHLSVRAFTPSVKSKVYRKQGGVCPSCKDTFLLNEMHGDHVTAWSKGGKTTEDNCQMLCIKCNLDKSDS